MIQPEFDFSLEAHRGRVLKEMRLPDMRSPDGTGCPRVRLEDALRYVAACPQGCYAMKKTMAAKWGVSTKTVSRWFACLVDHGLLHEESCGGRRKRYRICWSNLMDFRGGQSGDSNGRQTDVGQNPNGRHVRSNETSRPIQTDVTSVSKGRHVRSFNHPNNYEPPPTTAEEDSEILELLRSVMDDDDTARNLASRHDADTITTVVAEYQINRHVFHGPGAISHRLVKGKWPTTQHIRTAAEHERMLAVKQARDDQRRAAEAEHQRQLAAESQLNETYGPELDRMSDTDRYKFAVSVLDDDQLDGFRRRPALYRTELLSALARLAS